MRFRVVLPMCMMLALMFVVPLIAQDALEAGDAWITKWWMLDGQVTNTGGFALSAETDWLDTGTGGVLTDASASTWAGVLLTESTVVSLPDNGGDLGWTVLTIVPDDGNNMSTIYGGADDSDFETYAIIVISSPSARSTTIHPAHDDYAHIWLNGEKVYDNEIWTGGATTVTTPTDVNLSSGTNVLLYRCGESGGSDYFNLHFEASDDDLKYLPTQNDEFFEIINTGAAVEPDSKLKTTWGEVK